MAPVINMDPLYITGTVPRPPQIIKLEEPAWPWIAGAAVLGAGVLFVALSKGKRRRRRRR